MPKRRRDTPKTSKKKKKQKEEKEEGVVAAAPTAAPTADHTAEPTAVTALTFRVVVGGVDTDKVQVHADETTLYDLMDCVCELTNATGGDGVGEHTWILDVGADTNEGDMNIFDQYQQHVGPYDGWAEPHQISESKDDSTPLRNLPLAPGLLIRVMYDLGSTSFFRLVMDSSNTVSAATAKLLPRVVTETAAPAAVFLTDTELQASRAWRQKLEDKGETVFKFKRLYDDVEGVVAARPRMWSQLETDALQCLVMARTHKFTRAWNELLRDTMLFRTKSTCSGKWYAFKRRAEELDLLHGTKNYLYGIGDQPPAKTLQQAKVMLKAVRRLCLSTKLRSALDDLRRRFQRSGAFIPRKDQYRMWRAAGGSKREFIRLDFEYYTDP